MIYETYSFDGELYSIIVGENKYENSKIVNDANEKDMWFHVENMPSCHVILKTTGLKKIPRQVIKRCAYLCKINSNAKTQRKCNILYTFIYNVKQTEHVGEVTVKECKIAKV